MSGKYKRVTKIHLKKCPNASGDKDDLEDSVSYRSNLPKLPNCIQSTVYGFKIVHRLSDIGRLGFIKYVELGAPLPQFTSRLLF